MYRNDTFETNSLHPRRAPVYACLPTLPSLREIFSACADFQTRTLRLGLESNHIVTVCWLDGLVSSRMLTEDVIRPLTSLVRIPEPENERQTLLRILAGAVYNCSAQYRETMDEVVNDLTHGCCVLLFDSAAQAVSFEARSETQRAVSEPTLEKSIKGAKDAFVETLRVNTALVRRRLCTPKLKLVESTLGAQTCTKVAMLYLDGARMAAALTAEGNDLKPEDFAQLCDAFYVGGTKNALLFGEALVIVNDDLKPFVRNVIKQRGGMLAKGWLLGVQFEALFRDDLWLETAEHANEQAQKLSKGLSDLGVKFYIDSPTNQIFPIFTDEQVEKLKKFVAFDFIAKVDETHSAVRFVTSWATPEENVDFLLLAIQRVL